MEWISKILKWVVSLFQPKPTTVKGGDVHVGPGNFKAGDGGSGSNGGDLIIKGGDAKA